MNMLEQKIINLLESKGITPTKRTIGGSLSIVIKLVDDYTFTVRPHKYKPGYLSANLKKGDVLAEWSELDQKSLPLAIDYACQVTQPKTSQVTQPKTKQPFFKNPTVILWSSVIAFVGLTGGALYLTSSYCNYQRSNLPSLR